VTNARTSAAIRSEDRREGVRKADHPSRLPRIQDRARIQSTIIGVFRVLAAGLATARAKSPERLGASRRVGWRISESVIPISMENIHTDYEDIDSSATFRLTNGNELELSLPSTGGATLLLGSESKQVTRPHDFQLNYPVTVSVIPELGPLEHEEELVLEETVRRGLNTHRASRHFRNYWRYYPEDFEAHGQVRTSSLRGGRTRSIPS
jgi:hypothetical protein